MLKVKEREEKKMKKKRKVQVEFDAEIARELESTLQKQVDPTVQAQMEDDAAYAKKIQKELAEEEEREARDALELSKKRLSKIKKAKDDKEKFVRYLKTRGYSGKQLGPMKVNNLVGLYEEEKRKEKEKEEKRKYKLERELKLANDRGARIIHTVGLEVEKDSDIPTTSQSTKRVKTVASKKRKRVEKEEKEEEKVMDEDENRSKEEMGQLILHTEVLNIDPLAIKIPIVDWCMIYKNDKTFYKIVRADKSEDCYSNVIRIFKAVTREDLEEMYKIGMKKYGDRQGKTFDANFLLLELMGIMFEPEKVPEKVTRYTPIIDWVHYANCGVYSISRQDGNVEFYLVEKEYNHGLHVMMNMLQVKLKADSNSKEAMDLIWKITAQIRKLKGN